jgi:hypothetical protein
LSVGDVDRLDRPEWWNAAVSRFLERLASGPPLVGDGGMGTLVSSAVARLRCPEEANLRAPESVLSLHLGFIRAGAEIIETNTFGANRRKLAEHYLEDDVAAINGAAVKIARDAREVSGAEVFIAGSIGPLGGPAKDREAIFAEQGEILEGDLVDSDGTTFGPGDFVSYAAGTHHNSSTETGCLIAVFEWQCT